MITNRQLTEKIIIPRCKIHKHSQALLTHTRKQTEEESADTKGEWAYIVLKTQSSVRVYS